MAAPELMPETEITTAVDFRAIEAWPPLKAKEWAAVKEVLPGITRPDPRGVEVRGPNPPGVSKRSMILVPSSALPELDSDGPALHALEDDLAEVLGRQQMRYGRQKRPSRRRPGIYLGFSDRLPTEGWILCSENKLHQRGSSYERISTRPIINDDGSQTFEYRDHLNRRADFRRDQMHLVAMQTIAPKVGNLIACNVEVSLEFTDETPSLFDRSS